MPVLCNLTLASITLLSALISHSLHIADNAFPVFFELEIALYSKNILMFLNMIFGELISFSGACLDL
jgi:hypothetical protein